MGKAPLAVARAHMVEKGYEIDYRRTTVEEMAEKRPGSFDVITCLELLEHVPEPLSVVRSCGSLVKPDGHVFFATLNRNPWSYLLAIAAAAYILGLVPRGTHQYARFIKPRELVGWAHLAGLMLVNLSGLHYNPLLRNCSLGGSVHVNYLVHFRRPRGVVHNRS